MKRMLVAVAISYSVAEASHSAPLENDAIYISDWTPEYAQSLADDLSYLIKLAGYRCDTVSAMQRWVMSFGFTVSCNSYRYKYEVEDKGGRWSVEVK